MARRIACALLHLLACTAAEDLGVGLPQQWLRSSGPIARHRVEHDCHVGRRAILDNGAE